jgi:small-conductance mechanosensitive channel
MDISKWIANLNGWQHILFFVIVFLIALIFAWVLTLINGKVFNQIQTKKKGLHLSFFKRIVNIIIFVAVIIITISAFDSKKSLWQTLLGGTAILSAVLVFAAQDTIKDILAGLMISIHKPFEVGNRIMLEDGTCGVVEDMTMRHVVLVNIDTVRIVIPNSKINEMKITNYSYNSSYKSVHFRFSIGHDSDVDLAKRVILRAIEESEYSVATLKSGKNKVYSPVYFIAFADSALTLATTVYFKGVQSEKVIDDVNTRVRNALIENNIEIPYNYVTVVNKDK